MTNSEDNFRERLASIFENAKMSDISRRLDLPHATIRNYFGGRLPAPEVLIKIADETNVSLNWLLTGKGERYAGDPKNFDLGRMIDRKIDELIEQKLADMPLADAPKAARPKEVRGFDVEAALDKYGEPHRVMSEWFKFEKRSYPQDFGVAFFRGWESFTRSEKIDAIRDAKKVLDRTLSKIA